MKPVCYMRYLNGEPDWGEDCITVGNSAIDDHEDDADHVWESVPLYRQPPSHDALARRVEALRTALRKLTEAAARVCAAHDGIAVINAVAELRPLVPETRGGLYEDERLAEQLRPAPPTPNEEKFCSRCGLHYGEWVACEEPDCGELVCRQT